MNGGCYCGAIRYEAAGRPFNETVCHCSICRRATGAPLVAWFSVARAQFRFVQGSPARFRSSPHASRTFCPHCGTALTFEEDHAPDEVDVTVCSLDDPALVAPHDHTWIRSRLAWVKTADGLPEFPEAR